MPDDPNSTVPGSTSPTCWVWWKNYPPMAVKSTLPFSNADEIYKSYDLFHEMYDHPDVRLDTREFARARMFDIPIGDWSKARGQLEMVGFKKKTASWCAPSPRPRPRLSNLDGFCPGWLSGSGSAQPGNILTIRSKRKCALTYHTPHGPLPGVRLTRGRTGNRLPGRYNSPPLRKRSEQRSGKCPGNLRAIR